MLLYIDETENEEHFIVVGLLVNSDNDVKKVYKTLKKKINNMNFKPKYKEKILYELKGTLLDKSYRNIKIVLLKLLMKIDNQIIFSYYIKKNEVFNQMLKEENYIKLLSNIVLNIDQEINIIFDNFRKCDFEEKIINTISQYENVVSIVSKDSFNSHGLQLVDNLCSTIRLNLQGDDIFYSIISENVINTKINEHN